MDDKNGGLSRCKGTRKSGFLGEIKAKNKWKQSQGIEAVRWVLKFDHIFY